MLDPQVRTSDTHPITLSWVLEHSGGKLGLCYCPGKHVKRLRVTWKRVLAKDLARLKGDFGVTCIVCLLDTAELQSFKLRDYAAGVASAGLELEAFPIIEMQPPTDMDATAALIDRLVARMRRGQVLAVHCRGGVGRAGLIAACVLLHVGQCATPQAAIEHVGLKEAHAERGIAAGA
ncbi:hypothetical protein WJX72_010673 [[Myrmecia] bisecta]|uniref:protein-tyrosine-phosphatase n=1 Tax=[Myrmecia] bisecta TaxID=41462 RepID=A0AAW1P732_9CHLO